MDILTIIQAVFKRWYLTVPIVLIGLGGAYLLYSTVPPQYEASGQVLLADPELDPSGLPTALVDVGDVVARINAGLIDDEVDAEPGQIRASLEDPTSFQLTVRDTDPAGAQRIARDTVKWYEDEIDQAQSTAGIPEDERLRLDAGSVDTAPDGVEGEPFEVRTVVALRDPTAGSANPYGASNKTGRILTVAVGSDVGRQMLDSRTADGIGFELGQSSRDNAPILTITTFGTDPAGVIAAFDEVLTVVAAELEAREERAEVPTTRRTGLEVLAAPSSVTDVSPPLDRSVAAIIGLAGILAIVVAIATESIASRRHARQPSSDLDWFQAQFGPEPLDQHSNSRASQMADHVTDASATEGHTLEQRSADPSRTPS